MSKFRRRKKGRDALNSAVLTHRFAFHEGDKIFFIYGETSEAAKELAARSGLKFDRVAYAGRWWEGRLIGVPPNYDGEVLVDGKISMKK